MAPADDKRAARVRARHDWTIRQFELGEEPPDDLSETTTAKERLAMMWPLAVQAWALAGKPLPGYDRSSIPIRIYRSGELPPDDDVSR